MLYAECSFGIGSAAAAQRQSSGSAAAAQRQRSAVSIVYRAGFKLGGHIFEKGIFSVLYKHKLPRIFIGFSKVLKYVNFWLYIGTWPSLEGGKIWKNFWFSSHDLADKWHGGGTGGIVCQRNIQWDRHVPPGLLWSTVDLNSWGGTCISHKLHRLLSDWGFGGNLGNPASNALQVWNRLYSSCSNLNF